MAAGRDGFDSCREKEVVVIGEGPRGEADLDAPLRGLGGEGPSIGEGAPIARGGNWSLIERHGHSANQQKGKIFSVVLWVFGVVNCLSIFSCAKLKIEHGLSHEAIAQLKKEKEEAEEMVDRVMRDLVGEGIFYRLCSCSARSMFNMSLTCAYYRYNAHA
jgi:hypothetical protein